LCFVGFCSIAYIIYRIRLEQILKVYRLRGTIAKDLHDDVGSALSSIALLSSIAQDKKTSSSLKSEEIFSRIADTAKKMIELMEDIVWTVNPINDRFSNMLIRMKEYAVEMLETKHIEFAFEISEEVSDLKMPMHIRKDYFLIYKEAIHNISKYSNCSKAIISIVRLNHSIITIIWDDGRGFNPDTIHSGNGLRNMQERARTINGILDIKTKPGERTRIRMDISVP
jgi:signal transduction histidine kinase